VMRRALLLLTMFAGLALVIWSGYHNLRDRRAAELPKAKQVTLVPDAANDASSDPATASPLRGKPAPAFTLADLDGKQVSLTDFKGHPMVVNFWATYCEPCKLEMPWLEEFSHKYASDDFKVVGVTYDVEAGVPTISRDVHKLGVTYPILLSTPKPRKTGSATPRSCPCPSTSTRPARSSRSPPASAAKINWKQW
jgi:thiol-disulfide isomerase/thioredoxin